IRGPKRQMYAAPYAMQPLAATGEARTETLIAPEADGLFCAVEHLPGGGVLQTVCQPHSGGTFTLVLEGELTVAGETLQRWESAYMSAGEPSLALQAGAAGAHVLVMRVPATDPAYLPATQEVSHVAATASR